MFDFSAATNAALRHVYTGTAVMVGTLTVVGMSQGDATAIGAAVHQIGDGVASIVAGVSTLIPIAAAAYAAWTGTHKQQVAAVVAIAAEPNSPVKGVVTEATPAGRELAASIPGPLVAAAGTVEAAKLVAK